MTAASPTTYSSISLDVTDGVARLTLNRPDARNGLTQDMGLEIVEAIGRVGEDPSARVLLLTGAGDHFSVGADLKTPVSKLSDSGRPDLEWVLRDIYNPIVRGLRAIPQPVVSAVNGSAVGVAVAMSLAADIVLANESAYFLMSFVSIGLVPDGGATGILGTRIGHARAAEMMLLGERLPVAKAKEWGLVNEILPDDQLQARADEIAAKLAAGPPVAQAAIKKMLGATFGEELEAAFEAEAIAQGVQAEGDEMVEGIMAFLQKRAPKFA
ncbi:MAG: enoyl-CoA hydratase/isomerase family protein [Solirubrobacteraceae bacterium]|nr:enoyl-CoA hydratase/isomerase family protein [Solirubrobacteraceae bacterium]